MFAVTNGNLINDRVFETEGEMLNYASDLLTVEFANVTTYEKIGDEWRILNDYHSGKRDAYGKIN